MQISAADLPDNSPVIVFALDIALEVVNLQINFASPTMYDIAVYNLAADNLINFSPDIPGDTFFADLRKKWGINNFAPGVVENITDCGSIATAM